jgi:hypothetical protein
MEKSEQRVVIKFLWMKRLGASRIHTRLSRVSAMIATAPRRLNVGLPAFARAIFHAPIILDQGPAIDISE